MKKESLVAVIFGLLFGSLFYLVLINTNFFKREQKNLNEQLINKNIPLSLSPFKKIEDTIQTLTIDQPKNHLVVNKNSITIKGKAPKKSLIIIQSPSSEKIFENQKESFEVEFPLSYGANQIVVFSYLKGIQTPLLKKLTIYSLENKL